MTPRSWPRNRLRGQFATILFLAIVATGCLSNGTTRSGGPLIVLGGNAITVSDNRTPVGEARSAGSIPLCLPDADADITLQRIEPIDVVGEVHLDGIGVRTVDWGKPSGAGNDGTEMMVGIEKSIPPDVQSPAGYRVPTPCNETSRRTGEVVVTLTKTGAEGGSLQGLRITYRADGSTYANDVAFGFVLCGTQTGDRYCQVSEDPRSNNSY